MANTELKVDVDVTGDQQLGRLERKLYRVNAAVKALGASSGNIGRSYSKALNDHLTKTDGRWKKHFDDVDALIKKFGTATLGGLKLALKAAGAEMALMAISMVALHGLFKVGQGIMKAYTGALNVLSGAAAGATIALAGAAAAMREHQAAMFAYRGNAMGGYDKFVTGMNKVRVVMRGLHRDQSMVAAGAANLDAAFAAVSRNSTFTTGSQSMLRGLMDFAATGDLQKGMTSAGELIANLQNPKKSMGTIRKMIKDQSPQMEEALKEFSKGQDTGREALITAIRDGSFAEMGGVGGQWDAVSDTLISRFKAAATTIKADFADLGQEFLAPLKDALSDMIFTFRQGMTRVWQPLVEFGRGPFLDSLTGFAEKTTDMFVSFIRRGPEVEGMFQRIADRWKGFVDGWNDVLDRLRPLIDGARVLEEMFGNIFGAIGLYIRESFGRFNELLQENEAGIVKFGTRLGELFASFGEFQNELKELFFKALPHINRILSGVKQVVDLLTRVMRGAGGMLGGLGDGAGAYGLLASAMVILSRLRSWAGGFLLQRQTQTMNVTAGSVNIGGTAAAMGGGLPGASGVTTGGQLPGTPAGGYIPLNEKGRDVFEKRGMRMMSPDQLKATNRLAFIAGGGQPSDWDPKAGKPKARGLRKYLMRAPGSPSMANRFGGERLRQYREKWSGPRNRFNNSMSGKMGMGMGLGMLSGMVGEESQGAMALGGMASFMNPMIGLGIAGLGTAATSQDAMTATIAGAAGGAGLGMQFAGPWGALGGAIIGGAYGWLTAGARKAAAETKAAKEAGIAIADTALIAVSSAIEAKVAVSGTSALRMGQMRRTMNQSPLMNLQRMLSSAVVSGDTATMRAAANELALNPDYAGDIPKGGVKDKDLSAFVGSASHRVNIGASQIRAIIDNTEANIDTMAGVFSVGEEAILGMAAVTETKLMSATAGWGALAIQLSRSLIQNARELQYASADRRADRHAEWRQHQDAMGAPLIMDEAGQAINDILDAGGMGLAEHSNIIGEMARIGNAAAALTGSDTEAERAMLSTFGEGGTAFQPGGVFAGKEQELRESPAFRAAQAGWARDVGEQKFNYGEILTAQLTQGGMKGFNQADIVRQLSGLTGAEMTAFEKSGMLDANAFKVKSGAREGEDMRASEMEAYLMSKGIDLNLTKMTAEDLMEPMDKFGEGVIAFVDAIDKLVLAIEPGDTSTPRRGMVNMRGRLSGKNSDHLKGGAQDFFGSDLGALQSSIKNSGGYAEMHGVAKNRHLHGVPGGGGGGDSSNNYVINVTGGDNATPGDIADEVMDRIDRRSVDMFERG